LEFGLGTDSEFSFPGESEPGCCRLWHLRISRAGSSSTYSRVEFEGSGCAFESCGVCRVRLMTDSDRIDDLPKSESDRV
jgi:hypothetical protein